MARSRSKQAARRRAKRNAPKPLPTLSGRPADTLTARTATIVAPSGDRIRRNRVSGSGMLAGDGSGRLSDWTRPASLPYSLSVTTSDRRWDQTITSAGI